MTVSLPANATLEKLGDQARRLQRAVRDANPEALELVARHHSDPAHGDLANFSFSAAQQVVARAWGFDSWLLLMYHLDVIKQHLWDPDPEHGPTEHVDTFCRLACLTYDQDGPDRWSRARQLLAEKPDLTMDNVWAAAAANDLVSVRRLIQADPALATRQGGPYGWRPLFYLCYSRVDREVPQSQVIDIAKLLLDAGADPNEGYFWSGLIPPFTLLTGVFGEGEMGPGLQPTHPHAAALAALLLAAGADPNDGQTLYNRMFRPGDDHLELLFAHGLGTGDGGPWKARLGDALQSPVEMVRSQLEWAVSHGQVARVRLLIDHGVDVRSPLDSGRTLAEVAASNGHPDIVDYLVEHGAPAPDLDAADGLIAAAMAGDAGATALFSAAALAEARLRRPGLLVWATASRGHDVVALLIQLGFDVNAFGRGDTPIEQPWQTALHQAAFDGDVDLVRLLLSAGADPDLRDSRFKATPLGWASHGGHRAVVELLTPLTQPD